jgi:HEAT repeat protein
MPAPSAELGARLAALARPGDQGKRDALILESLGDGSPAVREIAVAWAARCLAPTALVPLIADEADSVRRNAALAALERQGPFALPAVAALTAAADPDLAMFACLVLGSLGSRAAGPALLRAVARPEINVVQAAAEALGRLRLPEAVLPLSRLLSSEPWLQLAAADALGAVGDPAAVQPLLALIPDSFVAIPALEALRRIGSAEPLPVLIPILLDPARVELRAPLLRAIAGMLPRSSPSELLSAAGEAIESDHSASGLWQFLADRLSGLDDDPELVSSTTGTADDRSQSRGGSTIMRAAGSLVLAAGVRSLLFLLLRRVADSDYADWIIPAARQFSSPGMETVIIAHLRHPDPEVRAGAIRVLAPSVIGLERLLSVRGDPESVVRLAAIDALGELADSGAAVALAPRLDGDSGPELSATVRALSRLPPGSLIAPLRSRLADGTAEAIVLSALAVLGRIHVEPCDARIVELATSSSGAVRRAALKAVAPIPGAAAEVLLLRALADRDTAQQIEALELLVERGGERVLVTLVALLGVADSLRYHVIRALGRLGLSAAAGPLEALFAAAPLHEQLEILASLGRLGRPGSRTFLAERVESSHPEVRRAAAPGFASLAMPEDLALLQRMASSPDWVLRGEAARALGRLDLPAGRQPLLDLARDLEPEVARAARAALGPAQ